MSVNKEEYQEHFDGLAQKDRILFFLYNNSSTAKQIDEKLFPDSPGTSTTAINRLLAPTKDTQSEDIIMLDRIEDRFKFWKLSNRGERHIESYIENG